MQRLFAPFQIGDHRLDPLLCKRIKPLLQKPAIARNLFLELTALFAHGSTAQGQAGANALSVIDGCRGSGDDDPNAISYVRFRTLPLFRWLQSW